MNKFTKEELELINKCIWLADTEHGLCRVFEVHKLQIKVQSLIDNYCEHKFYLNGCGQNLFAHCHKCGQISRVEEI